MITNRLVTSAVLSAVAAYAVAVAGAGVAHAQSAAPYSGSAVVDMIATTPEQQLTPAIDANVRLQRALPMSELWPLPSDQQEALASGNPLLRQMLRSDPGIAQEIIRYSNEVRTRAGYRALAICPLATARAMRRSALLAGHGTPPANDLDTEFLSDTISGNRETIFQRVRTEWNLDHVGKDRPGGDVIGVGVTTAADGTVYVVRYLF